MKRLILAAPLFLSLTACVPCFGQAHCIPIEESRWLHEQALKVVALDSVVNSQDRQIRLLEREKVELSGNYGRLLEIETQKYLTQKQITSDMERWGNSWRDQAEYYRKGEKKQRRGKKVLTVVLVGVIILTLIK